VRNSSLRRNKSESSPTALPCSNPKRTMPLAMRKIHDESATLKELQNTIYRERVLRARNLTREQRLADDLIGAITWPNVQNPNPFD